MLPTLNVVTTTVQTGSSTVTDSTCVDKTRREALSTSRSSDRDAQRLQAC